MPSLTTLKLFDKTIHYSFYALFFLIPLILTPWNYELFEYNKMMVVYALTAIIFASWLAKMIITNRIILKPTPLDIPIAPFFLSQVASFLFSIDRHVSFWGYYSRFHGGLLSTMSYIILYYAFVSNISGNLILDPRNGVKIKKALRHLRGGPEGLLGRRWVTNSNATGISKVSKLLSVALLSSFLVSLYAILQHFGIDAHMWVQDVQNRVFSTLGQPNWLAAYLAVLTPISTGVALYFSKDHRQDQEQKFKISKLKVKSFSPKFKILKSNIPFYFLSFTFYLALLYTKSRSGFLGFWVANAVFWLFLFGLLKRAVTPGTVTPPKRELIILHSLFFTLTFLIGTPFNRLNRYVTLSGLANTFIKQTQPPPPETQGPALETGGTESGQIRRIVWQGAVDIVRHHPLLGTGVETFAFAYYKLRPVEHNLTSEWDFLYNKAHNEYLNYAATTGLVGLGSYLLLIGVFVVWSLKKLKVESRKVKIAIKNSTILKKEKLLALSSNLGFWTLNFGLIAGYASILITNFFGFSVVIVALFFWLIPAMIFSLSLPPSKPHNIEKATLSLWQKFLLLLIFLATVSVLVKLATMWRADTLYARGYHLAQADQYSQSYQSLQKAIKLNPTEPVYHDEAASTLSTLALAAFSQNQATLAATLEEAAIKESNFAIHISPQNVNFWKTRTRVFYTLASFNESYYQQALEAISNARQLAPTDAKIAYNLALIQAETGKRPEAIKTLEQAASLKPNYREPHFALALFYQEDGNYQKSREELEYILENINPNDKQVKEKLAELSNF